MKRFAPVVLFIAAIWIIEFINQGMGHRLDQYGIKPGSSNPFPGIFASPFLHGGRGHLISNTGPMFILGCLVAARGMFRFLMVSMLVIFMGGLGTWVLGNPHSVHIGASGLIFGLFGYVLALAFTERSALAIITTIGVVFYYGTIIFGVLPGQPGISWEGHLCGMLAGIVTAHIVRARTPRPITA
jgi:membrane associated rhomboid family serine protease